MAIPYTPATRFEVADFGTSDHVFFMGLGDAFARELRIYTPGGLTNPMVTLRGVDDAADTTFPVAEGVEIFQGAVRAIRTTTTTGIHILGKT